MSDPKSPIILTEWLTLLSLTNPEFHLETLA